MPHDVRLVERVRAALAGRRNVTERRMFGGVCFLLHGNMCCGVAGKELVLRLGDADAAAALQEPCTRPMDFTGRPLKSMVYVEPAGVRLDEQLEAWLERALRFVRRLPKKS